MSIDRSRRPKGRRYRPFLIYNPRLGWAFYMNRAVSPLTPRTIGTRSMRIRVGWFVDPAFAVMLEERSRRV